MQVDFFFKHSVAVHFIYCAAGVLEFEKALSESMKREHGKCREKHSFAPNILLLRQISVLPISKRHL